MEKSIRIDLTIHIDINDASHKRDMDVLQISKEWNMPYKPAVGDLFDLRGTHSDKESEDHYSEFLFQVSKVFHCFDQESDAFFLSLELIGKKDNRFQPFQTAQSAFPSSFR